MNWKKKKRSVWICFAVASVVAIGGALIHPLMLIAGVTMQVYIMVFCVVDM
jgi:hypothetical protein